MSGNVGGMSATFGANNSPMLAALNEVRSSSKSLATGVTSDFQAMNATTDQTIQKMDSLSAALNRILTKIEKSTGRGTGGRYMEEFESMEAHLQSVRAGFSAIHVPESLKADLNYINTLLTRIDTLRPTIQAQSVASGIVSGNLLPGGAQALPPRTEFDNDYMRYQQYQQNMGTQGYEAVPLYDLDMSRNAQIKREAAENARMEDARYQAALKNGGNAGPDYRGMQMYQSDPDLARMIRQSEIQQQYKRQDEDFAEKDNWRKFQESIKNAGQTAPDYRGMQMYQSDPDLGRLIQGELNKSTRQSDQEYRLNRAKEMDTTSDRFYRDQVRDSRNESADWASRNQAPPPAGPQLYQLNTSNVLDLRYQAMQRDEQAAQQAERERARQRNQDEATEFENRRRMKEQSERNMRTGSYDSYIPLPTGFDNSAVLNQNQQKRRGQDDPERNGRRAFIGQQIAFGIDDMTQQFMWSNSTAGGVAAAARAGGNNMTAALGATGMKPGAMIGSMLGVQGAAMATSMYFKYIEETEKADRSTESLKKTIVSMQEAASREVKFKYSLEDSSSKELKEDEKAADRKQEETGDRKKFVDARASAAEANIARARKKLSGLYNTTGVGSAEDYRLAEEIAREEAVLAELTPEKDKLAKDKKKYEEEKPRREEAIKRKEAEEKRKEERDRQSKVEIDKFNQSLRDEEYYTGRKLTGEEYKKRYEQFKASRPDLNFNDENKQVAANTNDADRASTRARYDQEMKKYEDDRKFEQDIRHRMNPMGDIEKRYEDRMEELESRYEELTPEQRIELRDKAKSQRDLDVFEREREIGDGLRKGYRPLDGITQGSMEEANLNARLTSQVDSEGRDLQKEMNRLLQEIKDNTKPARRPETPVTTLPA